MHRPPAPLPTSLGPAFTYREAIALGVAAGRLRHRSLTTPTPGVRVADGEVEVRVRAAALAQLLPPGSAFSHHTAAALLDLPVPDGDVIEINGTEQPRPWSGDAYDRSRSRPLNPATALAERTADGREDRGFGRLRPEIRCPLDERVSSR